MKIVNYKLITKEGKKHTAMSTWDTIEELLKEFENKIKDDKEKNIIHNYTIETKYKNIN